MNDNSFSSIVIKACNEEQHICAFLESAFAALDSIEGEVILAYSGLTDRTEDIALNYPVRIVQLAEPSQRRCGVGPQPGFRLQRVTLIYILDGDTWS